MKVRKALEIAIENETRSYEWYINQALEADDPETRLLFEQIAEEERLHLKKLNDRLKVLKLMD
ncbi:ferritin family protein [Thermosyntropha sp.]|uniref:ferritin family protein n=1 Tax=Thermosyntropha sp. TaxID=2740820 RepID=UPI0026013261|nr:ferritin family protein [Thermosyntropha sp.]MBO8159249.1 rubrerythrin family protein [Thermosyntropha sp.]